MRRFFSNLLNSIRTSVSSLWKQMKLVQRITALSIVVLLIAGAILVSVVSSRPDKIYLFSNGIIDIDLLSQISNRLDVENIVYEIDTNNRIVIQDKKTAQYARSLLIREDLVPNDTDPWELFDVQRWTQTDFERNVNLQRSLTRQLEQHIEALDDVDNAQVTLVLPEDALFAEDRNPVTASVILSLKPGTDFNENRKKIVGVERLIFLAVEGLVAENLTISDDGGVRLNDFENLEDFDSLEQTKRELKIKKDYEQQYKDNILKALFDIYTSDRVRIVNINIEIDFSKKSSETTENFPIVVTPDNPETPYDEREVVLSIARSQENISEKYEGTGFNPEGPPGVEGQVPPSYKDLDGIVGSWNHNTDKINNEINQRTTVEEVRPSVSRVTASVAIDGVWRRVYDETGQLKTKPNGYIERVYEPLTQTELRKTLSLVRSAVGFTQIRGDSVSVENVRFDRLKEFEIEDIKYKRQLFIKKVLTLGLAGLFLLGVLFFIIRLIAQQWAQYKLRREEKLAEQYRRLREQQISSMQDADEEEEEETELQRLLRTVVGIVNENPQNVSMLVKSWMED